MTLVGPSTGDSPRANQAVWCRTLFLFLAGLVVVLLALRVVHLSADFPNHSRWQDDGAKYSDEGWYASGALNSLAWGQWYLPGDWAPSVIMPVWPILLRGVFAVTGISVVAARALEVFFSYLVLFLAWLLYRRIGSRGQARWFLLLLGASSMQYAFGRLALLEAPMVAIALACLLVSTSIRTGRERWQPIALGFLLPLLILTKTTGAFLLPAILYPIAFHFRKNWRAAVRPLLIVGGIAALLYGAEQFLFARHYTADAQAFFDKSHPYLNAYETARKGVRFFFRGFTWIDPIFFPIALAGAVASCWMRELWRNVLWGVAVLWNVFYAAFIIYHFDGPPRYFGVMTIPIIVMAVMFTAAVWRRNSAAGRVLIAALSVAFVWNAAMIVNFAAHPQYTLLNASRQIAAIVRAHPEQSPRLMGHGAAQLELYTALPATDDIFGAMSERDKLHRYHPGWVVIWNDEGMDSLGDITSENSLEKIASYPALDEPERNMLIFFRIVPKTSGNQKEGVPAFRPVK